MIQSQPPADPAAHRSVTDVAQAIDRPLEQSLQQVDALARQQVQLLTQQQSQSVQPEPGRVQRMA